MISFFGPAMFYINIICIPRSKKPIIGVKSDQLLYALPNNYKAAIAKVDPIANVLFTAVTSSKYNEPTF